ncbi:unnamed protein product [Withania somnifera]
MVNSLVDTLEYFQDFLDNTSKKRQKHCGKFEELEREIRTAVEKTEDVIELKIYGTLKKEGLSKTFLRTLVGKIDALKSEMMGSRVERNKVLNEQREREALRKTLLPFVKKIDALKRNVMGSTFGTNESQDYGDSTNEDVQRGDLFPGQSSRYVAKLNPENIVVGLEDDLVRIIKRLKGKVLTREIIPIVGMGGIGKTTLARKAFDDFEIRHRFDIHIWVTVSQEYWIRGMLLDILHCTSDETSEESNDLLMDLIYERLKCRRYLDVMDDIWSTDVWDLMTRTFPDDNNGSRIILTSRQEEVAKHADPDSNPHEMSLLNPNNSWKLLCDKVFGLEHACPPELVHIGMQVAQRCQGLPLALLVVAGHLSKISRTRESWKYVAKSVSKVAANESDLCLGVLAMSYNYLPDHLKPCYLYMGVFPEDSDVNIVRLINLWISEGFLSEELGGRDCLEDLVSRNLVMARNRSFHGEAKNIEAEKEKFLQVTRLNEATNPSEKKLRSARHYSFHSHDQTAFLKLSSIIRTLHFFNGFYLQAPLLVSFKLLRLLAILNVTFPKFPLQITELVQLRYLQFTCHYDSHCSISELNNLQIFILGHLVETLTGCTFELFSAIPNLKKLKIIGNHLMEMEGEHLNSLSCLKELEILKFRGDGLQTSRILSKYALPTSLKRLTLCYTSFPWEDMANIVMLPNLEVLKIKHNGFVGDVWRLNDEEIFNQLKFLLISWTGLKHWVAGSVNFPKMQHLFLKRCTNLEEIPQDFGEICTLESIELNDSISAAKSVKEIQEEQESMGNGCLSVLIYNNLHRHIMVIQAPLPLQSVNTVENAEESIIKETFCWPKIINRD